MVADNLEVTRSQDIGNNGFDLVILETPVKGDFVALLP